MLPFSLSMLLIAACGDSGNVVQFADNVYDSDDAVVVPQDSEPLEDTALVTEETDTALWEDTDETDVAVDSGTSICGTVDPNEMNDAISSATPTQVMSVGDVYDEYGVPLHGPRNDHDVYEVSVPADCTVNADLSFVAGNGDIDMRLLSATGAQLDNSAGTGSTEHVDWTNNGANPATVFVDAFVYNAPNGVCTEFDIHIELDCDGGGGGGTGGWSTGGGGGNPNCGTDPYEPNNTVATATPTGMAAGGDTFADTNIELDGTASSTNEDDFYQLIVPAGCTLEANVYFVHANGDIDLAVQNATGTNLLTSTSTSDNESITWTNTGAADAVTHVRVYPWLSFCSEYDIDLEIDCTGVVPHTGGPVTGACGNDPYELNQTIATATPTGMAAGGDTFTDSAIEMNGLTGSIDEDDFYALEVPAGCTLDANVYFVHANGDIDLAVQNATGTNLLTSVSTSNNESISWTNTGAAAALTYVRVYDYSTNNCTEYDIDLEIDCAGVVPHTGGPVTGACGNDPYELNQSIAAATPTGMSMGGDTFTDSAIEMNGLAGSIDEDDFYGLEVPPGCTLEANVYFASVQGDIDLAVQNAAGTAMLTSASTSDDESISWTNTGATAALTYVRVYMWNDACSTYDIDLEIDCTGVVPHTGGPVTGTCGSDPYELNQSIATATPTGMSMSGDTFSDSAIEMNGLSGSIDEDDFYGLEVPAGCTLDANIYFANVNGDIDLAVQNAGGTNLLTSTSTTDNESISWTNTGATAALTYVRVYPWLDFCSVYDIDLAIDCP